jgi:hypothetical protein
VHPAHRGIQVETEEEVVMNTSGELRHESGDLQASTGPALLAGGDRPGCARRPDGAGLARPARSLVRVLYTSNPFYILSADLVFAGLRMSFGPGGPAAESWALAGSLAGYTLLLAATACVLIRLGRLWDDLRTLLLLVVMMFLAIAMSCDDTMAADPRKGIAGCAAGLAFAVAVSEVVLGTIRLRLPGWYRAAYYAILGLVFLYPVALVPLLGDPEDPSLQWALFGFAPTAALAVAMLVPAARRGRAGIAKNGSPWRWPLYPWSLFLVLIGALCVRSWSLCVSFHYVVGSRSIFGPYFLVPIGMAVALVWLEIGIAARRRGIMTAASLVPLVLACLAMAGHRDEWVYRQFVGRFITTLGGSPAYLTLLAAVAFLAYAGMRRVPAAVELMGIALAGLAVVGPRTVDLAGLDWPRALPMAGAGIVMSLAAWRHRDSRRALLAAACLVVATTRGAGDLGAVAFTWPIALHLAVAALMALGVMFDDGTGRVARHVGAAALLLMGLDAATGSPRIWPAMPARLIAWYPLLIAAWGGMFGLLLRDRLYLISAGASLAGWLGHSGVQTYGQLRKVVIGLDQIAWGMLFFLLAMAISLRKAGIWPRVSSKRYDPLLAGDASPSDPPGSLARPLDRRL